MKEHFAPSSTQAINQRYEYWGYSDLLERRVCFRFLSKRVPWMLRMVLGEEKS